MGIRKKFEAWILKEEFNQDTFQTFVCWMLFAGMICSLVTPAWLVLLQSNQKHCVDGTFTILAHFRIHSWLYEMFEDFKDDQTAYDDICFELIISDSQFQSSDSMKPSLWIPENLVWLDEAENDLDTVMINNRTKYCTPTANIPMGLVTWTSYAEVLNYGQPLNYSDFLTLADIGWTNYTDGSVDWGELSFSHSHPNVTGSGALGMVLGVQAQTGAMDAGDSYSYTSSNAFQPYTAAIRAIEQNIHELGPNELTGISNFLGHGPDYIHAMYGFENDVAYNDYLYNDLLEALWEDKLAFVYFSSSFWMTHPSCILADATWMNNDMLNLAEEFQEYILESSRKEELLDFGIRPFGVSRDALAESEIINTANGVNPNITSKKSLPLGLPDYDTVEAMRVEWQKLKEPVYLRVLLDVSFGMQTALSGSEITRWSFAIDGLEYFAEVLESAAVYEIQCFTSQIYECGDSAFPNGTLGEPGNARSEIIAYIEDESIVTSQEDTIALWRSLNESLADLRLKKLENEGAQLKYNYVMIVISEDDNDNGDDFSSDDLLDAVGINYSSDEIHIFPVLFWGEDGKTEEVMKEIAVRTNGEYSETQKEMPTVLEEIGWYF